MATRVSWIRAGDLVRLKDGPITCRVATADEFDDHTKHWSNHTIPRNASALVLCVFENTIIQGTDILLLHDGFIGWSWADSYELVQ